MARILIRPEDLARLAQRFDAAADDLARAGRRLARARAEVRLNPADETFPGARVAERAEQVEGDLRRLAADFRVDAGLMASTVDDAELGGDSRWTLGLQPPAAPGAAPGHPTGHVVGSLGSVMGGLASLSRHTSRSSPSTEGASTGDRSIGAGGLFAVSSSAESGHELLARITERLGASSPPGDASAPTGPATSAVWTHIVGELFAVDDDP